MRGKQLPRHPVPPARAAREGAHLRRRRQQVPLQPRLQLQGHGPLDGHHGVRAPVLSKRGSRWDSCGWDKTGPAIFYVDSEGDRFKGDVFSVGSGATMAYGVLDQAYHWDLTDEEALELGRRSIYAAGHRDAYSGNSCNLYHVKEDGWHASPFRCFLTLALTPSLVHQGESKSTPRNFANLEADLQNYNFGELAQLFQTCLISTASFHRRATL